MTHSTTGRGAQPGAYGPFAHLTAPNAVLYRHVMRAFVTAKERFAVHLRPEDVYAALPAGGGGGGAGRGAGGGGGGGAGGRGGGAGARPAPPPP
ncbi:DUF2397 family protein, partial [Streptomyces sp. NPDC127106]|uniref:DUF2397 family protein n=1 Tax=Streptomyces sp. NPDC127106 TaxID=3345360 RepID=UPI00362509D7